MSNNKSSNYQDYILIVLTYVLIGAIYGFLSTTFLTDAAEQFFIDLEIPLSQAGFVMMVASAFLWPATLIVSPLWIIPSIIIGFIPFILIVARRTHPEQQCYYCQVKQGNKWFSFLNGVYCSIFCGLADGATQTLISAFVALIMGFLLHPIFLVFTFFAVPISLAGFIVRIFKKKPIQ